MNQNKQYILRDPIHLDIVFPQKYFDLINTTEFQRLSRIKQLSCEYLVFPTASHTRFSHSIGTYYVMGEMINRFEEILLDYGIKVTQEEKDLAFCSALLHDIGHGPFSHTFEKIFKLGNHESWTAKIIRDPDSQINRVLNKNFSKDFVERLIDILSEKPSENNSKEVTIITLISQLISSQIDADRMDYLLRDSYFTSVSNGHYDIKRLIKSFDVAFEEEKLRICVNEKYIASIEEYIMARFYMHKEAYQHPIKIQMENILIKIFKRAKELYSLGMDIFADEIMKNLFEGKTIRVSEYTQLDDSFMYFHILKWKSSDDEVLNNMCTAFLDRKKYKRYREVSGKKNLSEVLNEKLKFINEKKVVWEDEYSYIKASVSIGIYDKNKDNIWVKLKNGSIKDITEISFVFKSMNMEKLYERTIECYSEELIRLKYGQEYLKLIEQ